MAKQRGHNAVDHPKLTSIVDRIERLVEERKAIQSDIKDLFAEAKGAGFDPKALRAILRERQQAAEDVEEHLVLCDLYRRALDRATEGTGL